MTGHGLKDTVDRAGGLRRERRQHRRHRRGRRRGRGGARPPGWPDLLMVTFVDGPVRVSVPATSANLGPGFDSLGLALSMRDELEAEVLAARRSEVDGRRSGCRTVPLRRVAPGRAVDARRLRAAWAAAAGAAPGRATTSSRTPAGWARPRRRSSRGSGWPEGWSPVARCCVDDDALFRLAARIEGHPDNVAPAFFGGFVISGRDGTTTATSTRCASAVDPRIEVVVFVPPDPVSTEVARGLLPADGTARRRGGRRRPHGAAGRRAGRPARAPVARHPRLPPPGLPPPGHAGLAGAGRRPACRRRPGRGLRGRADGARVHRRLPPPTGSWRRCPDGWPAHHLAVRPRRRRVLG